MTREEFWKYCQSLPLTEDGCRLWDRGLFDKGYPDAWVDKKKYRGHRLMLELKLGRTIKPGFMALHTCDIRNCVAEGHLYEGTNLDNMRDRAVRNPYPCGDAHHSRRTPWVMSRGDRHYARTNPEKLARGEKHGRHRSKRA